MERLAEDDLLCSVDVLNKFRVGECVFFGGVSFFFKLALDDDREVKRGNLVESSFESLSSSFFFGDNFFISCFIFFTSSSR